MSNQFLINTIKKDLDIKKVKITASGSSALFHILNSLNLDKTDEILLSSFNCEKVIVVLKILKLNYKFVDISKNYLSPSLNFYKNSVSNKTRVIIHPHLWGYVTPDIKEISIWAEKNNIILVEDIASSYGLSFNNKNLGTFGNYCFGSFNSTKPFDLGGGGFCSLNKNKNKIPLGIKILNSHFYNNTIKKLRTINNTILLNLFINLTSSFSYLVNDNVSSQEKEILVAKSKLKANKKNCTKILKKFKTNSINTFIPNNDQSYSPRIAVVIKNKKQLIIDREIKDLWVGIDFTHPLNRYTNSNKSVLKNTEITVNSLIQVVTDTKNHTIENIIKYLKS